MELYETITDTSQDPPYVWTTGDTSSTWYAPPLPASQTRSHVPYSELREKSPLNSNGNWRQIRDSGAIVMSPYYHRSTITESFVVGSRYRDAFVNPFYWLGTGGVCRASHLAHLKTQWTQQGDFPFWSKVVGLPVISLNSLPDELDAVSTTQSSAAAAFLGGYDVLTEIAERRETIDFFRKTAGELTHAFQSTFRGVDPEKMRDFTRKGQLAKDLLRSADKATRAIGERWLAFRYAVMPLYYSYKDIKGLVDDNGLLFKSFRNKQHYELTPPALPSGMPGRFIFERFSGSVQVKSLVKGGYTEAGLSSLVENQVQINPFATAWELVPFSFVADWFINVGDYIVAKTSLDMSAQSAGCTSIRKRYKRELLLVDEADLTIKYDWNGSNKCFPNGVHVNDSLKNHSVTPLLVEHIDHYDRVLFDPRDVRLSLYNAPMEFWKRQADAAALTQRDLKKVLRSM